MAKMTPSNRPQMLEADLIRIANASGLYLSESPMFLVGYRGYYRDTMGLPGVNDRGIYDDAMFLMSREIFVAYNANCDPSRVRRGKGVGAGKGMANLKLGLWRAHRFGKHRNQYEALIQTGGPVTVIRDGLTHNYEDTGYFGINIHKGGYNTTSSEGCQTIHPNQWNSFIANCHDQAKRIYGRVWRSATIPYLLVEKL
ncbi:MAG: hypothetical protein ACRCZI_09790 [Cetobacterium sp.]